MIDESILVERKNKAMHATIVFFVVALLTSCEGFISLGMRSMTGRTALSMAKEYNVRVINEKMGKDVTLKIPDNAPILDSFEIMGNPIIPYSCRAGSCSSCLGKLIKGSVDQSGQIFLDDDKVDMGYVLTCAAYPTSDIEIRVNIEDEYYNAERAAGK